MSHRTLYIAAYDVSDAGRLRAALKLLKGDASVHGRCGNDAMRRIGQCRRHEDADWRRDWDERLVTGKRKGQMRLLRKALHERPDLRYPLTHGLAQLERARERVSGEEPVSVTSLRGIEGAAAAAYFQSFARLLPESLGFTERNRRPPRDPANAVLSLGYTLGLKRGVHPSPRSSSPGERAIRGASVATVGATKAPENADCSEVPGAVAQGVDADRHIAQGSALVRGPDDDTLA